MKTKGTIMISLLAQMAREALAKSGGHSDAAVEAMRAKVASSDELHWVLAVGAVDSLVELQLEKQHGPVKGTA